ncbi:MAG: hypothetical protein ACK56F_13900 [bacterium]
MWIADGPDQAKLTHSETLEIEAGQTPHAEQQPTSDGQFCVGRWQKSHCHSSAMEKGTLDDHRQTIQKKKKRRKRRTSSRWKMTRLNEYGGALDTIQQGRPQEKHQVVDLHTEGTLSMYKRTHHREEHCATEIAECIGCKRHTLFSKAQSKEEHCEHSQTQYYLR